jgi:Arc/MetJ-type ribon-helix-helix transcriptional regulator
MPRAATQWEKVLVRLTPEQLAWVNAHVGTQPGDHPSTSEAIRALIEAAMKYGWPSP